MGGLGAQIVFQPLVPWPAVAVLGSLATAALWLALQTGMRGAWVRGLAMICILAALSGPSLRQELREPLSDIVILVKDESASQTLSDRPDQAALALSAVEAEVASLPNTELRVVTVPDALDDGGTALLTALAGALSDEPRNRVAGAILVTDGQIHDAQVRLDVPAPVNVLLTGDRSDWDRRLRITRAPAYGIIGEETAIGIRIEEQGAMPGAEAGRAVDVAISINGSAPQTHKVPVNQDLELPLTLGHAGQNVVQFSVAAVAGELTDRNNIAVVSVNGVRDRLRALLISGEPYAGERTWRNLLKSDSAVDLVHFTILRPPDKEDGVPVDELSLIAFPTRELFVEKVEEFDLIIFDRYPLRGILPGEYLDNIRDYILAGGAVLVAAGPDYASAESLYYSGLGDVMPADPTTRVVEGAFLPTVSDVGRRHPVTEGLEEPARSEPDGGQQAPWGRWLRYVEVQNPRGQVVLETPDGRPLLILNREGEGRVALLASDQAWLWGRGYEGGGPQQELLRRLAHWMMHEPELEEEALGAQVNGDKVTITRRSLSDKSRQVRITDGAGNTVVVPLPQLKPGFYGATWKAPAMGFYRMTDGEIERVFALGPAAPREFENAVPTEALLQDVVAPTNGGFQWLDGGVPDVRHVRAGRPAAGRGWIGITPRAAYRTVELRLISPLPDWLLMVVVTFLMLAAWLVEGRRRGARAG